MNETRIDITHIPFSRYGAYVSVTREEGAKQLVMHNAQRRFDDAKALYLSFGENEDFSCYAEPEKIVVETKDGKVIIYIRDDHTVALESHGVDILWKMVCSYGYGNELGENRFRMISVDQKSFMNFLVEQGEAAMVGPIEECGGRKRNRKQHLQVKCKNGIVRMAVMLSCIDPQEVEGPIEIEKELEAIQREWQEFLAKMPESTQKNENQREFCRVTWYNLWSSFARANDVYHDDIMLMSKKFMSSVWSWDHCFNALTMAKLGKEKAMDEFYAPFHLQSPKGALPDMWNPYFEINWGVTKPPIHGWCFSKLMDQFTFSSEELVRVYGYLSKWTDWWMKENDSDHDGVPEYPQGCDSGWDNSTLFDDGFYLEVPDLSAFLILQMYALGRISEVLGSRGENDTEEWKQKAEYWKKEAQELTKRLYEHCWIDGRFVAKASGSHNYDPNPSSLLSMMPLVLGEHLDEDKREKMVEILKKDFMTEYGLATEMPESPRYESDGYWRGPIWAPNTYLLIDGLARGGEKELAADIAKRYCRLSAEVAKGNYENFDALTGKGLRAPGYTWSASVYMLLNWEYGNI